MESSDESLAWRTSFLEGVSSLSSIGTEVRAAFAAACTEHRLEAGDPLLRRDQPTTHLYVVVDGELAVQRDGLVLNTMGPRQLVGEISALDGTAATADVVAQTATRCLRMEAETFQQLTQKHAPLAWAMVQLLDDRLRFATQREVQRTNELAAANRNLRAAQARLVQSEKMVALGRLVAGVAHEVNTPLGSILSSRQTLTKALPSLQKAAASGDERKRDRWVQVMEQSLDVIGEGAERIGAIITRLRSFARLDQAEQQMADINDCVQEVCDMFRSELRADTELKLELGDVPPLHCMPRLLNQALLNLLLNAHQAIEGPGIIIVETETAGDHAVIEVRDSGCGVADHIGDKIFDPGFTTRGVGVGTGLGLPMALQNVQEHGGDITFEAAPEGGACFRVTLPLAGPPSGPPQASIVTR
jgi:signal transduction histidine kinase